MKSEIRILKTIDFTISATPVVYAESILKFFSMTKRPDLHVNSVWSFICILMDVMLMERETIYNKLIESILGDSSRVIERDKNRLKADWMLVACALVCAGSCCHYGFDIGEPVAKELEQLFQTPSKDTSELAIAILEVARRAEGRKENMKRNVNRQVTTAHQEIRFVYGMNPRDGSMPFAAPM
ncbi:hypothetical protein PENTCL1PPCAC_26441, partial [Pristionchus entomophagus]